jgi:putative membrane protein
MHINTLIPLLLTFVFLFGLEPHETAVLIVATGMSEIFFNFIPSIFLGAPEADTALSVLPGHRLLIEGRGYEAIKLTVIGGMGAVISSLLVVFMLASWFQFIYEISRPYVHFAIIAVVCFMILSEKKLRKIFASILILALSGMLGILVLNSTILPQQQTLLPVLGGLFGLSILIISVSERSSIPQQSNDTNVKISTKEILRAIILGSMAGIVVGFLPAIGISEAATIVQYVGGTGEARSFLVTLSGINVGNEIFSLISLYLVGNPRSGASVAIQNVMSKLTLYDVLLLVGVICFVSGITATLTLHLGKKLPRLLAKINYKQLTLSVIIFLVAMIFVMTGFLGLLVLMTSTAIGILCSFLEIRRSHCMGCLLIPTILFFAGLNPLILTILKI